MSIRLALAAFATFAVVGTIAATSAVVAAAGSSTIIGGAAGRDVPYQTPPRQQDLAALKLAPAQTNTIYVSVTPCRIMDTRLAGGRFSDNTTRTYKIAGSSGFAAQGGNPAGCGIPLAATAISANVTANTPSTSGYVRAWPSAIAAEPNATVANYTKGEQITAGATLSITPGVAASLKIRNHHGPVDLALDVTGYYAPQMHGMISPASSGDATHNAPVYAGSSRIVSATNPSDGVFVVTFDGNITYCTPMVDTYNAGPGVYGAAYAFNAHTATVFTWYLNNTTHVEVPFNFYFYVSVVC